jgi:hypothetical protein
VHVWRIEAALHAAPAAIPVAAGASSSGGPSPLKLVAFSAACLPSAVL